MASIVKKTIVKKSKTNKAITSHMDLMLDGTVYIVEYNKRGKIISKVALDGEAVLKALLYVLGQSIKNKTKKP